MRTSWLVCAALGSILPACGGGGDDGDDAIDPEYDGGRFAVEGCGFDVITRAGAEAPTQGDAVGADPAPRQIRLGFAGDPRDSIAVVWRTDLETTASTIEFGEGTSLGQTAQGVTYTYKEGIAGNGDRIRLHEAHLCGLEPDTEYSYRVGAEGAFSETFTFRTAPDVTANPDATVTVAFVGDSRNGPDVWAGLVEEIVTHAPDLVIYTGDVVTIGDIQLEWDGFLDGGGELFATAPTMSAHGNHELNSILYYSAFALPGDEENYSFDYGHMHQTIVNTDPAVASDLAGRVSAFLDSDLAAATATWKIVSFHRAIWSSSVNHGTDTALKEALLPAIDEHAVDVVIAGHDHTYERTKPLRGDTIGADFTEGTVHIVSGGAGAPLYTLMDPLPEYSQVAETSYNFTIMEIGAHMLESTTYRDDGSILDQFAIAK